MKFDTIIHCQQLASPPPRPALRWQQEGRAGADFEERRRQDLQAEGIFGVGDRMVPQRWRPLESSDPAHLLQNLGRAGAGPMPVSKRVASSAGSPEPLLLELLRGEQARQSRGSGARLGNSCSARLSNGGGAPAR
jgi:hypothetical protein